MGHCDNSFIGFTSIAALHHQSRFGESGSMKRSLFIVIVIVLLSTAIAVLRPSYAAHESAFDYQLIARVNNTSRVTVGAQTSGQGFGTLESGERVIVIGRDPNNQWFRIRSRVGVGYVR